MLLGHVKHLFLDLEQLQKADDNFALFKDKEVFKTSKTSWIRTLQLLWRYGYDLIRLNGETNQFLSDFERYTMILRNIFDMFNRTL